MSPPNDFTHPLLTLESIWREHEQQEERLALSLYALGESNQAVAQLWRQADTREPDRWHGLADRLAMVRRINGEPIHEYPVLAEVLRACTDPGESAPSLHNLSMVLRAANVSMVEVDDLQKKNDPWLIADRLALALEKNNRPATPDMVRELRGQGPFATAVPRTVFKPSSAAPHVNPVVPAALPPLPPRPSLPGYLQDAGDDESQSLGPQPRL